MGVENILVIVTIKHFGMPGELGNEMYKMVVDRAKELLTTLHLKVIEAEKLESMNQLVPYTETKSKTRKSLALSVF